MTGKAGRKEVTINNPLIVAAVSLLGIITFVLVYPFSFRNNSSKYKSITIQGRKYQVKVATNSAQWTRGLMYVEGKQDYDGMLFVFPDKAVRTFWNMNTFTDLEVLWMDDDRVLGKSQLPSIKKSKQIKTVSSPGPANRVVELLIHSR